MVGLPKISDSFSALDWISERTKNPDQHSYSAIHADHGFVGFVDLAVSCQAAFLCFWVGVDFQGRGYAAQIATLACELAAMNGISHIFTSAYKDNFRSIKTLSRVGFATFEEQPLPPNDDKIYFYLPTPDDDREGLLTELIEYNRRCDIALEFSAKRTY